MQSVPSILVVDDEPDMLRICRDILESKSHQVVTASDGPPALELIRQGDIDVAVFDLHLPSMTGLELMREALRLNPQLTILIITAYATLETAIQAVREGAFDFIPKPFSVDQFEVAIERGIGHRQLEETNRQLLRELQSTYRFENVIADSPQMKAALDLVRKVASTESNVLVLGESGTGKELIAYCLHLASSRSQAPFVPLDCASLPEALIESELFGYEKGAFTGASSSRMGLLESASGGTLFLDEIGNLSVNLQAKLLRVLQEKQYRRVGGRQLDQANVRFVSATNRNLEEMIQSGLFREDLFFRLNVVSITLPPLRDRSEDIPALTNSFLEESSDAARKGITGISSAALMVLQNHNWPGNVRELKNVISRAISLANTNQITPLDLPPEILQSSGLESHPAGRFRQVKQQVVKDFEQTYLRQLLVDAKGNVTLAAQQSGMKRSALHRLLRKHKLHPGQFRKNDHA